MGSNKRLVRWGWRLQHHQSWWAVEATLAWRQRPISRRRRLPIHSAAVTLAMRQSILVFRDRRWRTCETVIRAHSGPDALAGECSFETAEPLLKDSSFQHPTLTSRRPKILGAGTDLDYGVMLLESALSEQCISWPNSKTLVGGHSRLQLSLSFSSMAAVLYTYLNPRPNHNLYTLLNFALEQFKIIKAALNLRVLLRLKIPERGINKI